MLKPKEFLNDSYSLTPDEYITYYIKPDYTLSNKNNITITNSFAYMWKPLIKRAKLDIKSTKIELNKQIYFTITIKKGDVKFYISIPSDYETMIKGKMETVWNKAELRCEDVPLITDKDMVIGELIQRDYNFKSLNCSTQNLYPLTNLLGITKSLTDGEEVRITLVVENLGKMNWLERNKNQVADFKSGKTKDLDKTNKEKLLDGGLKVANSATDLFIEFNNFFLESIMGLLLSETKKQKKEKELRINIQDSTQEQFKMKNLSEYSRYKLNSEVFKARILITSMGATKDKNKLNIMSVANAYRDLEDDNELILKMLSDKECKNTYEAINSKLVKVGKQNIFSDKEIAKFIQLPQKDLQNEYKMDRIDTREVEIPEPLTNGKVRVGNAEDKGRVIPVTFNDNYNVVPRTTVLVGAQGSGKTTILKRMGVDNYKAGFSNFVLDYVEDCETARDISKAIPDKDKVVYDVGAKGVGLSLSYNEISKHITEDMDVWSRVRYANLLAEQLELLLNAVVTKGISELTAPMLRYLHAASMVTFIRPNATIGDVFKVIKSHKARSVAVKYAQDSRVFRMDDEIFSDLEEIDKKDKDGKGKTVIGTRTDLTVGIENRIVMLNKNPDIKEMLNNPVDTEDDFGRYIEEGKTIIIRIPQNRFPNAMIRDVLAVYYFSRLWLAVQIRKNNKDARLCNVIIDEVGQVEILSEFIGQYCTEFRRHRLGLLLAMHHLEQMKGLLKQLTSSGASYMLLAGIEKKNVKALEEEIKPFEVDDVLKLKTHTALCVVNYGNQYAKFVASQPIK